MDQWTLFQTLFNGVDGLFLLAVQTNSAAMAAGVNAAMVSLVTVWFAATSAMDLFGQGNNDAVMACVRRAIRAAFVLGLLAAANYTSIFATYVLTTAPNELMGAFTGAAAQTGTTPAAFDKLLNGGWAATAILLKQLNWLQPSSILLAALALVEFAVGAVFIAIAFLTWMMAHIMLGLAIIIGPLFVACLLWEKAVYLFNAWVNALLSLTLAQVLVIGLLVLLLPVETQILQGILVLSQPVTGAAAIAAAPQVFATPDGSGVGYAMAGQAGSGDNDIAGQVHYFIEAALIYFAIGWLAPKVVALAERLTSGAAPGIAAFSAAAQARLASGASAIAGAAGRVAGIGGASGAAGGAAGMRSISPTGRAVG